MIKYLHLHVRGYPQGYYEEERGWKIVNSVPQEKVRFLAGGLSLKDVEELRKQARMNFRKSLPIYD